MDSKDKIFHQISAFGIVPVIAIDDAEQALPLADALIEGGLPVIEVTFRTPAAAKVIETIAKNRPEILVGAGTVLTLETLKIAKDSGAVFAVAPGLNPRIVEAAADMGMPFIPGVATPSEIEQGLSYGLKLLKFFPAQAMGGLKYLSAIYAPYKSTGVKFMATGGIDAVSAADWLASPAIAAVGGSWIAKPADMAEGKWTEIASRCRIAAAIR